MKFMKTLIKKLSLGLALVVIALFIGNAHVKAATVDGPMFNYFTDASGIGDEHDFLRVQKTDGSRVNTLEQCDGEVSMWFYVHNSQAAINNGDNYTGPAVAKNTRLRVAMPTGESKSQEIKAFVSADNAATVSDNAYLTCGNTPISLSYAGLSELYTIAPEGYDLTGDLTSAQGAALSLKGYQGGLMPGCWDHRVRLTFKVKITKKPVVIPSDAICTLDGGKFIVIDNKKRTVKGGIKPQLTNAVVTGYKIDWGDGTAPSTNQNDTHSYKDDGEFTIQASYTVKAINGGKFADGSTEKLVSGTNCATKVKFETGKPPVVTPPTVVPPTVTRLTATGPASTFAIFAAVSILGAFMHRAYMVRKAAIQE